MNANVHAYVLTLLPKLYSNCLCKSCLTFLRIWIAVFQHTVTIGSLLCECLIYAIMLFFFTNAKLTVAISVCGTACGQLHS